MKKILILGSEGFIGLNAVKKGLEKKFIIYGCDIIKNSTLKYHFYNISLNSDAFTYLLKWHKFDCIINCAGSGNVAFSVDNPVSDFDFNVKHTLLVLDSIRLFQQEAKYVHISSAAVYGNPLELPIAETALINPISPYGFNKYHSEILCSQYSRLYGLNICIVRPFSVYGPGLKKQIIWETYLKGKKSDIIQLFGNGNETRDFIFIDDLIEGLFTIAQSKNSTLEIYNISSGIELSIKSLLNTLFFHLGWNDKKIEFNQIVRKEDPNNWQSNISKLTKLGFSCSYSIDTGLLETAKWLLTNG